MATSRVNTSVTTKPYLFAPRVFWEKSMRFRLQAVVRPSAALFPRLRGFGASTCLATSLRQCRLGPRTREVRPPRKLPPSYLEELAGVSDVKVPGQLLEQPDGLLLCHFLKASGVVCLAHTTPYRPRSWAQNALKTAFSQPRRSADALGECFSRPRTHPKTVFFKPVSELTP